VFTIPVLTSKIGFNNWLLTTSEARTTFVFSRDFLSAESASRLSDSRNEISMPMLSGSPLRISRSFAWVVRVQGQRPIDWMDLSSMAIITILSRGF
jgi:hypothetical protein